jgi:hypothetical protein
MTSKTQFCCHPERSEGSALSKMPRKKQIPRRLRRLGMTSLGIFQQAARRSKRDAVG